MIGGAVEEATRKGKVVGSNPTAKKARLANGPFLLLKSFFLFLKIDFVFSVKTFLQAVHITEPPVEIYFYRRFLVTACRIDPFLLASSTGGAEKRQ